VRIAILTHGVSPFGYLYARAFVEGGHEAQVFSMSAGGSDIPGVATRQVGPGDFKPWESPGRAAYLKAILPVRRAVRQVNPDILFGLYLKSGGLIACLSGHPHVVVSALGSDLITHVSRPFWRHLFQWECRRADAVHAVSAYLGELLLGPIGVPPERLIVSPVGVDLEFLKYVDPSRRPNSGRILCTRSHWPVYDQPTVVRALARLKEQGVPCHLTFTSTRGAEATWHLVAELGLEDRISFQPGYRYAELPALLGTADLYVSASLSDGTSQSLLEAMSTGAFPVVTDIPANRPWVEHGRNGFLFRPGDVAALAKCLGEGLARPELRLAAAPLNRAIVMERGNLRRGAEQLVKVFQRCLAGDPRPVVSVLLSRPPAPAPGPTTETVDGKSQEAGGPEQRDAGKKGRLKLALLAHAQSAHFQRWASWFGARGHDVHFLTFTPRPVPNATMHVIDIGEWYQDMPRWRYALAVPKVKRLLEELQPDVVHAHYLTSWGMIAALAGRRPLVVSARGSDVNLSLSGYRRWLVGYCTGHADLVNAVSEDLAVNLRGAGVPDEKLLVLQYGVDRARLNPEGRHTPAAGDPIRLVCTRWLVDKKYDLSTLLRAVTELVERGRRVHLVLAAPGPDERLLRARAKNLGIASVVEFRGGYDEADLPQLLKEADIYVSPSPLDGTSISLLEAMACGMFPIVTDIPANRPWLREPESGIRFPCGDSHALAQAIERVGANPDLWHQALDTNQRIVREYADRDRNLARFERIYEGLAAGTPARDLIEAPR
jgi:glycosyltransferase involved in cell wall biosynthesis